MVKLKVEHTQSGSFSLEELNELIEKVQEANGQKDVIVLASKDIIDQIFQKVNMANAHSENNDKELRTGFFHVINGVSIVIDDEKKFAQEGEIVVMPVIKTDGVEEVISGLWEDFYVNGEE